ncbi:LON peptidase N-terminal domain and RING finger protein 3-like [Heterodontus francisci]|uniref:LON peptidase N-terminal domain and RING finger protein 3-like n=1 Tax=Heterodontus francisci TaxID=7792 RepID=UPI00355BA44F
MASEGSGVEVMLELAAEAFRARNFQLAAEIYHQCQPEETEELRLKRAHCLVLGERLSEALEEYQLLSQKGRLRAEHLEVLVGYLADSIKGSEGWAEGEPPSKGLLSCLKCTGTLFEPVTLRCGHSYCKNCLEKERERTTASSPSCKLCKEKLPAAGAYRINVVLNSFLGKYFPTETRALTLRHEGNVLYKKNKPLAALERYHEAIALAPKDHLLWSNRAQIYVSMNCFEDALCDGSAACSIQPFWPKGHLRKAQALAGLQKMDKALKEYLICIALDSENKTAKMEAQKILCDLLSPIADNMLQRLPDIMQLMSPRSRIKGIVLNSLNSRNSSNVFENSCKVNVDKACVDTKQEWKAHSYCNLAKPAQVMSDNEDTLKNLPTEPTRPEKKNILKTKHNIMKEDKPGTTDSYNKCKRARTQSPSREHDVLPKLVDAFDLECSLCMRLYYEPITTPCGHTFCLKCIERCMDHSPKCPLCKEVLPEYQALRKYNRTVLIEELIAHYLPEELAERNKVNDEEIAELSNLNKDVPIFICTMAYPTVPCPLHIFEPRYRLMIRRCMETGNKQFGMCLSDPVKGFADYGCMLEVRSVELFPDGRSVVDTIGRRRFKVLRHNEKDGYSCADIEYIEDEKVEGENYAELVRLHDLVYDQAYMWFSSLKQILKTRILSHFGPMPKKDADIQASPNGPGWCWWLLAVLPLESRAQLPFLAMTMLQERLNVIRRVLLFMSRNCPR